MKIKSIKKIGHLTPRCSCGTGYTEPDVFAITLDNGTKLKVEIDIWYVPLKFIRKKFEEDLFKHIKPSNLEEAYKMYVKEIAKTSCHWTEEEILNAKQINK